MPHLYLAAPQKSSGKTTLAIGLCRALRRRGLDIQPFKKGPDYIDPFWLTQAAGRPCFNLDFHTMSEPEICGLFAQGLAGADLGLIEGNVGLFDSTDLQGAHSNAELAKLLGSPVVLVVNCQGLGRGIAPLLLGYQGFDPKLKIAGVILNRIGGGRHGENLRRVVEHYTDLPVLGLVPRDEGIAIAERHLGLIPSNETRDAESVIEAIAAQIDQGVDFERLLTIAHAASVSGSIPIYEATSRACAEDTQSLQTAQRVRIGIARDAAFGFYYPDDLAALTQGGAELVPFSPLADPILPEVDALFIGGGFPECHMARLEANGSLRAAIRAFIARGGPVYAECGGLMYLCRAIRWGSERREMVGALDAEVEMRPEPQGRGYVRLVETEDFPWPRLGNGPAEIPAHEFHHSLILDPDPNWRYGYAVRRGRGIDGAHDGIVQGNVFACYSHLRATAGHRWTERFLAHVRRTLQTA
ncbi:cobyrinate a,c-diamide synthase [Caldichromatium japonicum]|uniref:Cobyrinate a,c-diamide synthase n=1 Tax=Caldichromatium japonicum TaxID=2699430 RepID=A0A6G7VAQ3_9GAMM|nr:cobyrinate a,c-diamide synthase [Caldichromatium japonicum]QIK37032.1 cobyrinate a,c-diamide synthase [Caldichromatium japonicum]